MSKIALVLVLFCMILTSAGAPQPVDDIREALFRHQMSRWKASTYYLAFGNDRVGDFAPPPQEFMERFTGQSNVKKSLKAPAPPDEASVILCIDRVRLQEKSAEVSARFVPFDLTKASAGFYNLALQKDGSWKVTGAKRFKVIPLS
jgi:hypothetical protein